jgi:hypothetical protein
MVFVRTVFASSLLAVLLFLVLRADLAGHGASEAALLDAARGYVEWGRVDDRNRWAPTLCAYSPSTPRMSQITNSLHHGRKLFYLFARDREAYVHGGVQPDGQTIVKEAWHPRALQSDDSLDPRAGGQDRGGNFTRVAEFLGEKWVADRRMGLFLMHKSRGEWTYAVASADGSRLHERGRLATCHGCHDAAGPDRLFGLSR